jgi:hypothetical protein
VAMPARFDWKAPHVLSVMVKDNAMAVAMDGSAMINIPDLEIATGLAINKSSNVNRKIAPPRAGGYGFVALPQAQVSLQQMTLSLLR